MMMMMMMMNERFPILQQGGTHLIANMCTDFELSMTSYRASAYIAI